MRRKKAVTIGAVVLAVAAVGAALPAGAASYDRTSPVSTGCSTKGPVDETRTAVTVGPWTVRLRRSTGCNTAWGFVQRTDGKKCNATTNTNCARITITRVTAGGTIASYSRKQVSGTVTQYSLQLGAMVGATYTAKASTFGGAKIATSRTLRYNADGTWSLV